MNCESNINHMSSTTALFLHHQKWCQHPNGANIQTVPTIKQCSLQLSYIKLPHQLLTSAAMWNNMYTHSYIALVCVNTAYVIYPHVQVGKFVIEGTLSLILNSDYRASAVPTGTVISHPSISFTTVTWQPRRELQYTDNKGQYVIS